MTSDLVARGVAFGLLAALLGPESDLHVDGVAQAELDEVLGSLHEDEARAALAGVDARRPFDAERLARRRVRWFDQGRVGPYECSHLAPTAGGHTTRLADIAGFMHAFGMKVSGERPDHVTAELELMAVITLAEAEARSARRSADATVCADAARTFLRDHLGSWLGTFAERVATVDGDGPWGPTATAAARFVDSEARRRNVIPVHVDDGRWSAEEALPDAAPEPACGSEVDGVSLPS